MTSRKHNTDRSGNSWSETKKNEVWNKGTIIPGLNSDQFRNDKWGKKMQYSEHGNRNSINGWEIDHINPVSNSGGDEISNLQPLHWANNADKAGKTSWSCPK